MARGVIYVMTSSAAGMVKIGKTNTKQFESRMYMLERNGYYNVGNLQRKYAIEVDDFDAAIQELREKGCTFVYEPATLPLGKLAMILDPNGVKIAVIQLNRKHGE